MMEFITEPNIVSKKKKHFKTKSEVINVKSNFCNALKSFLKPEIEEVKKLDYFQPQNFKEVNFSPQIKNSFKSLNNETMKSIVNQNRENISKLDRDLELADEKNMKFTVAFLNNKLDEKITKNNSLTNLNCFVLNEVEEIEASITILDKLINTSIEKEEKFKDSKSVLRVGTRLYTGIESTKKEINFNTEIYKNQLKNNYILLEEKKLTKAKLKDEINTIEDEIKSIKVELNENINKLLLKYHSYLQEGIDTRNEGLIWIIKSIWNLKHEVLLSYMPQFIDEITIKYLFKYALKDIELTELRNEFNKFKEHAKFNHLKRNSIFKTFVRKSKNEKSDITKMLFTDDVNKNGTSPKKYLKQVNLNFVGGLLKQCENDKEANSENLKYIKQTLKFEKKINDLKKEMTTLKENELIRLNLEFGSYDYERRFKVKKEKVISVIVGKDNLDNELNKLSIIQRVIITII